jgi:hypothetical protein
MQLTVNVPDRFIGPVEDKLYASPGAVLQSIARNAVIAFLVQLAAPRINTPASHRDATG